MFHGEGLFFTIVNELEDGIYLLDPERHIVFWNRAAERITGYDAREVVGKYCHENILDHVDALGQPLCYLGCPMSATLSDGQSRHTDVFLRHKNGHRVAAKVKSVPIKKNNRIVGAIEIFTEQMNPTEYSNLLDILTQKVMTDTLTGLSSRNHVQNFLEYKLKEHQRFGRPFCVLFIDLDNFHDFNSTYGHNTGDKMLKTIAKSFTQNLRASDMIGRWGGEEFVGVFSITDNCDANEVGEKIRMLVAGSKIAYDSGQIGVSASVGVALAQKDDTIESLIERADRLMYQSKARGKNCTSTENTAETHIGGLQ